MFLSFFFRLRDAGFPVSLHEYLALLQGLDLGLVNHNLEDLYFLSRSLLVKDEAWLDRFDTLFGAHFRGEDETGSGSLDADIPEDWLLARLRDALSPEERDALEASGGLDALLERLRNLLREQRERHEGGSKWIGTGGTSPYGNGGAAPEGIRMGGDGGNRSAVRIWNRREFRNLSDEVELDTRNIKMALRRLRLLTREGRPDQFDLDGTVQRTSRNGGMLDISMVPERKNRVKVLLFLDTGGSMDDHVRVCEQLFSAARHEFKHMAWFYFHNCIYESVWKDNRRRHDRIPTLEVLARYNKDYKVIVVGDAAMAPYELLSPGGSIEHRNEEAGIVWLRRLVDHFDFLSWINPNPDYGWSYFNTTRTIRELLANRMFPMTLDGLDKTMRSLKDRRITHDEVWVRG